jgi:hypothetical protein
LFQLPLPPGPSSPGAKPKPFGPLLPGFLARQCSHALHDSSTCGKVRPHAGQRRCCTWKFGLSEAWAARWHACSSLVIWAHRRVVEVARELLRAVEELEEEGCSCICMLCRAAPQVCSGTPLRLGLGIRCCGTFAPAADLLRVGDDWLVAPTVAPARPARGAMMACAHTMFCIGPCWGVMLASWSSFWVVPLSLPSPPSPSRRGPSV